MEVYVLVRNDCNVDGGLINTEVIGVYENFSMAQTEMQAQMNEVKQYFQNCDYENDIYAEGDMSWSIWEVDGYTYNRVDLIIECKTVQ